MTTKEYLTHWNHSRRGKVVIDYDATGGVVAVRVHLANERLVDRVHSKQHAREHLGLRSYTKRDGGQLRMERFPDGKAPEGEGWEASQTDEKFAAAQEEYAALVADDSIPTLPEGEWKCDGYPWYWYEAGLEWDGKDIANVFVGCSPPTKSTIFSAGHGQQFDGNSVLLQRRKDEHGVVLCVCVSGAMPTETGRLKEIVVQCNTLEGRDIREYVSPLGNNDVPYHYAIDTAGEPTPGGAERPRSTAVIFCHLPRSLLHHNANAAHCSRMGAALQRLRWFIDPVIIGSHEPGSSRDRAATADLDCVMHEPAYCRHFLPSVVYLCTIPMSM